jgi:hypothetical protein
VTTHKTINQSVAVPEQHLNNLRLRCFTTISSNGMKYRDTAKKNIQNFYIILK